MHLQDVAKHYPQGKQLQAVIQDVTFEVPAGQLTALIGPNGSGKSTLLNMMSRLEHVDNGHIAIDRINLVDWSRDELARRLAIMKQHHKHDLKVTVESFIAFGRFPHSQGKLTAIDRNKIDEVIRYLHLEPIRERYVDELSGGQRQRVVLAMVMAQDTEYVLLDEPLNNLDICQTLNLMHLLRQLVQHFDKRIVIIMHDINTVAQYADYVIAIKNGQLWAQGTVDEMMRPHILEPLFNVRVERIEREGGYPLINFYKE